MPTKTYGFHILRVGLAITFLWIGLLILKNPAAWGSYLQPWAAAILPVPIEQAMLSAAIFDIVVGFLLLLDAWTWVVAFLAAGHIVVVLIVSGINEVTVRDIGLLTGAGALFADAFPKNLLPGNRKRPQTSTRNVVK